MNVGAAANPAASEVGEQMDLGVPLDHRRPQPVPPSAGQLVGADGGYESCWMCGISLPPSQMMPDGGRACADLRWYCRDTRACTERWTARAPRSATGSA